MQSLWLFISRPLCRHINMIILLFTFFCLRLSYLIQVLFFWQVCVRKEIWFVDISRDRKWILQSSFLNFVDRNRWGYIARMFNSSINPTRDKKTCMLMKISMRKRTFYNQKFQGSTYYENKFLPWKTPEIGAKSRFYFPWLAKVSGLFRNHLHVNKFVKCMEIFLCYLKKNSTITLHHFIRNSKDIKKYTNVNLGLQVRYIPYG